MKKIIYVALIFILGINMASAKPVTPETAKKVAENFYKHNSSIEIKTITLAHTEVSNGLPIYYAFNINENDGFVIIAGEDAVRPVIGYSTKNYYVHSSSNVDNFGSWMSGKAKQINSLRESAIEANEKVSQEWSNYLNNTIGSNQRLANGASVMTTTVGPLMQSTWNQSPYYNAYCPGSTGDGANSAAAVTGCVATTMAQIMRYWSYPAHGTGTHSYTQNPNPNGYPAQSANFGATTYDWNAMPLNNFNITSSPSTYSAVAQLMYQCGVSVNMNYAPSGSGAQVLNGGSYSYISAQSAYVNNFSYNKSSQVGIYKSDFTDAAWIDTVESDLNIGRCVQYVGTDPSEGGHTWVCDGYDANNYLHMNWGWAGSSDGYFQVDNLQTPGFNPTSDDQALLGIIPIAANPYDAGVPAILSPSGFYCATANDSFNLAITLKNYGNTALMGCSITYQIDNNTAQSINWSGSLVPFQAASVTLPNIYAPAGSHKLTCYSSNPNGATDANGMNDTSVIYFNVSGGAGVLPLVEGFESATTLPNSNWSVSSSTGGVNFAITSSAAATGSNSCMLDNMSNTAKDTSTLETVASYNLASFNTPTLTFKAAYQQKSTSNNDILQILTSTNCGASWVSKKVISSATLAGSNGTGTSAFVPTSSSQFTTYSIPLTSVATYSNVIFKWAFYAGSNGPGNDLYIDDINIYDANPAGIKNIEAQVGLNVYPNPSSGIVNVEFDLSEQHNISVNVTDMIGRTVETINPQSYQSGTTKLTIGSNNTYQAGVYLVSINIDGQKVSKKIIIQ